MKTGNIMQDTLLTNVTRYLSNIITVTSLIWRNCITKSDEVTFYFFIYLLMLYSTSAEGL